MKKADEIRLRHILDSANEALGFAKGKTREDLYNDRMLVLSLVKSIEIIGEAASRLEIEFRLKHEDVPWDDIISMRNRLIHAYFDINLDIVWNTVRGELPDLISKIQKIVSS